MRIAHVISTREGIGGAERVVAALADAGPSQGAEQAIINPFASADKEAALQTLTSPSAAYVGVPVTGPIGLANARRAVSRAIAEFSPDIIHAHLFHAEVLTASLRLAGRTRILTHHHGADRIVQGRRVDAVLERRALRRFDHIVAVSDSVQEWLASAMGVPSSGVSIIPNGWAGDPLPADEAAAPTIVCVASLRPKKGHETLITAMVQVVKEVPDTRLVLVGSGSHGPKISGMVQQAHLDAHVDLVGATDDVWPYLAEASVIVSASTHEPGGIAVLEGMAAGLPVVASAVGGLAETVIDGETGLLVPPGNATALAEALTSLLNDPGRRAAMGEAGRKRAELFTAQTMTDRYFDLYRDLLDRA